jgi:hypothetical protein
MLELLLEPCLQCKALLDSMVELLLEPILEGLLEGRHCNWSCCRNPVRKACRKASHCSPIIVSASAHVCSGHALTLSTAIVAPIQKRHAVCCTRELTTAHQAFAFWLDSHLRGRTHGRPSMSWASEQAAAVAMCSCAHRLCTRGVGRCATAVRAGHSFTMLIAVCAQPGATPEQGLRNECDV